jgi:hypothetical protein
MSTVIVSRLVRQALETQFTSSFNSDLSTACGDFGISSLAYSLNFGYSTSLPQNYFHGNWSLEDLLRFHEPILPALTMWTGEGGQYPAGQREMPRDFSGYVFAHWRFFLAIQGRVSFGLTDLREATESAVLSALIPEFSPITYRGDLAWQATPPREWTDADEKQAGFVQEVEYQASFEVNV